MLPYYYSKTYPTGELRNEYQNSYQTLFLCILCGQPVTETNHVKDEEICKTCYNRLYTINRM